MLFLCGRAATDPMLPFVSRYEQSTSGVPAKFPVRDALSVGIICAIGFALRAWNFPALSLTHYDEGANALSGFWSLQSSSGLYPWQKFFAPPGYLGLVGIVYWFAGHASDLAAIGINVFFGTATILLVWWIGKRWFGRCAAIFSATLVALSEFQVAFSRTALTDTLFGFLFLLALVLIALCFEKQRLFLALAAGAAVGAAWNVKYHGWLLLAITFAALALPAALKKPADSSRTKKIFFYWCTITGVAALCFLPWVLYTEFRLGGYLAVEKFHHQYLNFHWIANLVRQVEFQAYFDGWLSRVSPMLGFLTASITTGIRRFQRPSLLAGLVFLVVAGFAVGSTGTWFLLALYGLVTAWTRGRELGRLLAAAFLVFFVLTPCYTPFARLLLPWVLVAQILAGAGVEHFFDEGVTVARPAGSGLWTSKKLRLLSMATAFLFLLALAMGFHAPNKPSVWEPTTGSRDAVDRLMPYLSVESIVFVTGEPNVAFYFQRAGYHTFCIQHLAFNAGAQDPLMYKTSSPVYVIGGKYARDESDWLLILHAVPGRFQLVARVPMQPSDVRLLDDESPREALAFKAHPDSSYDLELFRLNYPPKN
jgi:dolichyl-phosphate-mannose-protein mannosyltransferase